MLLQPAVIIGRVDLSVCLFLRNQHALFLITTVDLHVTRLTTVEVECIIRSGLHMAVLECHLQGLLEASGGVVIDEFLVEVIGYIYLCGSDIN